MKLTILGNNGPLPSAGGACSGYLIREGKTKILIDCGNGVLSNLLKLEDYKNLDAIILTHMHNDHMSDMMVLRYGIQTRMNRGYMNKPLKVFAPSEPGDIFNSLAAEKAFDVSPIDESLILNFDNLQITFKEMRHPVKCFAVSIELGGKRFVFSGDTSWTDDIISFSKGADILMIDAGLLEKDKTSDNVPHLTARECGIVGSKAGVGRLLLTHFWPDYDMKEIVAEAREGFAKAEAAILLNTYEM